MKTKSSASATAAKSAKSSAGAKQQRATSHAFQADWIDNQNTPQPDLTGLA